MPAVFVSPRVRERQLREALQEALQQQDSQALRQLSDRLVHRHGPVQLVDGPEVEWMGGHNPLSATLSAYIVIDGDPPHYLAFGQAEEPDAPPGSLEGIYFNAPQAPHDHHQH